MREQYKYFRESCAYNESGSNYKTRKSTYKEREIGKGKRKKRKIDMRDMKEMETPREKQISWQSDDRKGERQASLQVSWLDIRGDGQKERWTVR